MRSSGRHIDFGFCDNGSEGFEHTVSDLSAPPLIAPFDGLESERVIERGNFEPAGPANVADNYACPLCGCSGAESEFRESIVAGSPICDGCAIELSHFLELDERENDPVLDELGALTGLSFIESRRKYYREGIAQFEWKLSPANREREAAAEIAHTRRSANETVAHWRWIVDDYKRTLALLDRLDAE